jgi:Flp pilus assembly protein TadG
MVNRRLEMLTNRQGAVAIEFAMLAPMIVLIFVAFIEFGMMEISRNALELAAREASRYGMINTSINQTDRLKTITDTVQNIAGPFFDPGTLVVSVRTFASFDAAQTPITVTPEPFTDLNNDGWWEPGEPYTDVNKKGQWDADMNASDSGTYSSIVVYQILARHSFITPFWVLANMFTPSENVTARRAVSFQVNVIVKNEP